MPGFVRVAEFPETHNVYISGKTLTSYGVEISDKSMYIPGKQYKKPWMMRENKKRRFDDFLVEQIASIWQIVENRHPTLNFSLENVCCCNYFKFWGCFKL